MGKHLVLLYAGTFVCLLIFVLTAWRDYQAYPVRYDCGLLIGGWHPDFPAKVIEECRKKGYPYDSSKTRN